MFRCAVFVHISQNNECIRWFSHNSVELQLICEVNWFNSIQQTSKILWWPLHAMHLNKHLKQLQNSEQYEWRVNMRSLIGVFFIQPYKRAIKQSEVGLACNVKNENWTKQESTLKCTIKDKIIYQKMKRKKNIRYILHT